MLLTPMRYRDFVWPHNPRVYTISFERVMDEGKVPFGLCHLQDLGRTRRVMRGEGEFAGPEAYAQFAALGNTFYAQGPGLLIHPLWQPTSAYFVELALRQEPRPDYISYTFTFWEDTDHHDTQIKKVSSGGQESAGSGGEREQGSGLVHRVVKGDTLWGIARRYGVAVEQLIARNPQIKNPNLILVGWEVRVK